MGAALRLTCGFTRIDRAWSWDEASPLYGIRHRTIYEVWRAIVEQAGYPGCKGLGIGETDLSAAHVSRLIRVSRSTVTRAITYLSRHGLVTTQKRGRRVYLFVPYYELTSDMEAYLAAVKLRATIESANLGAANDGQKFRATINASQNTAEKSVKNREKPEQDKFRATIDQSENQHAQNFHATIETIPNKAKILGFDPGLKTSRNNRNFHATIESDSVQDLSSHDHRQNNCCMDGEKNFAQQSADILKELNTNTLNILPQESGAVSCAKNEHNKQLTKDSKDSNDADLIAKSGNDMATGKLTEFDIEIAEMWRDGIAEVDQELGRPPRRIKINDWAHVVRLLREQDGFTEAAIYHMSVFRFEDEFYRYSGMCLGRLRSCSKNGFRKSVNLLDRAKAAHKRKKAQRAKQDDLGEILYFYPREGET